MPMPAANSKDEIAPEPERQTRAVSETILQS
jgi:hypothetical protein